MSRAKVFRYLSDKSFKVAEGAPLPPLLFFIKALFFPRDYLKWKREPKK